MINLDDYFLTVLSLGLFGFLIWTQLAVIDVVNILKKHPPGFDIAQSHDNFQFRAGRAFSNSNENAGIFILFVLFGIAVSAHPSWLNGLSIAFVIARALHALFYYFDFRLLRSIAFAVSFVAMLGMFIVAIIAAFS